MFKIKALNLKEIRISCYIQIFVRWTVAEKSIEVCSLDNFQCDPQHEMQSKSDQQF
jgi:hypothetical protein